MRVRAVAVPLAQSLAAGASAAALVANAVIHETRNALADVALDPKSTSTLEEGFVVDDFLFGHD
jgi:hypothetical protein